MNLTLLERETTILFNEKKQAANIYTHNARLKRRLKELCRKFPGDAKIEYIDGTAVNYIIPKNWIKINPPAVLTDEQKNQRAQNAQKARRLKSILSSKSL